MGRVLRLRLRAFSEPVASGQGRRVLLPRPRWGHRLPVRARRQSPAGDAGGGRVRRGEVRCPPTGRIGDQEQYAALTAVLARSIGIPARVGMGFEVPEGQEGNVSITGEDVTAWVE